MPGNDGQQRGVGVDARGRRTRPGTSGPTSFMKPARARPGRARSAATASVSARVPAPRASRTVARPRGRTWGSRHARPGPGPRCRPGRRRRRRPWRRTPGRRGVEQGLEVGAGPGDEHDQACGRRGGHGRSVSTGDPGSDVRLRPGSGLAPRDPAPLPPGHHQPAEQAADRQGGDGVHEHVGRRTGVTSRIRPGPAEPPASAASTVNAIAGQHAADAAAQGAPRPSAGSGAGVGRGGSEGRHQRRARPSARGSRPASARRRAGPRAAGTAAAARSRRPSATPACPGRPRSPGRAGRSRRRRSRWGPAPPARTTNVADSPASVCSWDSTLSAAAPSSTSARSEGGQRDTARNHPRIAGGGRPGRPDRLGQDRRPDRQPPGADRDGRPARPAGDRPRDHSTARAVDGAVSRGRRPARR